MGFFYYTGFPNVIRQASFVLIFSCSFLFGVSQTYVYKGGFKSPNNLVLNIRDGEVREQNFSYGQPVICTVRDNQIYARESLSVLDILVTNRNGFFYRGYSDQPMDIVYNFDGEKWYYRDQRFPMDLLYTVYLNGIYPGPTTFIDEVLFTIEGSYSDTELFAILWALGLL